MSSIRLEWGAGAPTLQKGMAFRSCPRRVRTPGSARTPNLADVCSFHCCLSVSPEAAGQPLLRGDLCAGYRHFWEGGCWRNRLWLQMPASRRSGPGRGAGGGYWVSSAACCKPGGWRARQRSSLGCRCPAWQVTARKEKLAGSPAPPVMKTHTRCSAELVGPRPSPLQSGPKDPGLWTPLL